MEWIGWRVSTAWGEMVFLLFLFYDEVDYDGEGDDDDDSVVERKKL